MSVDLSLYDYLNQTQPQPLRLRLHIDSNLSNVYSSSELSDLGLEENSRDKRG